MLNIVVCIKAVPDPRLTDKLKIDPVTKSLPRLDIPLVMNSLDSRALEAALQLQAKYEAHVTVLSMGPPSAGNIVRECLALGADKGILLSDAAFAGADAFATAYTLAKAIEKIGSVDLVLCGMASSDGATEWVGPEIATFLNMPVVTMVREIVEDQGDEWIIKADADHGYRKVRLKLPALLTVTRDLNQPKPLSFSGILRARSKEITTWNHEELGIPEKCIGLKGSPTHVTELSKLENRREVQMLQGTLQEKVESLIEVLSNAGGI
jgi:electron transfer flavoprotein alpha/beta subunit